MLRFFSVHSLLVAERLPSPLGHVYIVSQFLLGNSDDRDLAPIPEQELWLCSLGGAGFSMCQQQQVLHVMVGFRENPDVSSGPCCRGFAVSRGLFQAAPVGWCCGVCTGNGLPFTAHTLKIQFQDFPPPPLRKWIYLLGTLQTIITHGSL